MNKEKLTREEKKQRRTLNKKKKEAEKKKKRILTTADWLEIEKIHENFIELKDKAGKTEHCVGIKIIPPNISLENPSAQMEWVLRLRNVLNKCTEPLYHAYIYSPINLDEQIMPIQRQIETEEDQAIVAMLENDIRDWQDFARNNFELEFAVMMKKEAGKQLEKKFRELVEAFFKNGFQIQTLNRIDFENLISFSFNNELINDVYFSHGDFAILKEETMMKKEYQIEEEKEHGKLAMLEENL